MAVLKAMRFNGQIPIVPVTIPTYAIANNNSNSNSNSNNNTVWSKDMLQYEFDFYQVGYYYLACLKYLT